MSQYPCFREGKKRVITQSKTHRHLATRHKLTPLDTIRKLTPLDTLPKLTPLDTLCPLDTPALPGGMTCDTQAGAPGYDSQADASGHPGSFGYTALPGGMACDLQESPPGCTQQDTVVVTQPTVKASQEQAVPPSNLGISIFACFFCCSFLGKLKFGLISSN